jgi:hypothetical protein
MLFISDYAWLYTITMVAFAQFLNPAHGCGRILQVLSKTNTKKDVLIPPTAVGGYFKLSLFINPAVLINSSDLNDPPTSVGGIQAC